ncbi:zinc finger, CCHC-type containing protein [Tanacetum coccineum]
MRGFEAYEQFLTLNNQEAKGSGSGSDPKKKRTYIPCEREEAEQRLLDDYFGEEDTPPKYMEENFRRRNCPKSLHGQFKRRDHKYLTLMLEAVADQKLWIRHAYFGVPGENNDLNMLYGSPLFDDVFADRPSVVAFVINRGTYNKGYYLANGIYVTWATFVKTYSIARDEKTMKFKRVQESARKDIERVFGVLQDEYKERFWCSKSGGNKSKAKPSFLEAIASPKASRSSSKAKASRSSSKAKASGLKAIASPKTLIVKSPIPPNYDLCRIEEREEEDYRWKLILPFYVFWYFKIIVLSSNSSNYSKGVPKEGPSVASVPEEGPSIQGLLDWYGYNTVEKYLSDTYFPSIDKDNTNKDNTNEDTIYESYSPMSKVFGECLVYVLIAACSLYLHLAICSLQLKLAFASCNFLQLKLAFASKHLQLLLIAASNCSLHLHLAIAACICILHLHLAFASFIFILQLQLAFASCNCSFQLQLANAACSLHLLLAICRLQLKLAFASKHLQVASKHLQLAIEAFIYSFQLQLAFAFAFQT